MFYAVRVGRKPGIYSTWAQCFTQVDNFPQASYRKFPTQELALEFLNADCCPRSERRYDQHNQVNMSKSLIDAFNTVKATAKDLQSQMERMSSTFATLSNQMQTLEKSIKSSDSAGSKRSYSDDGISQTPEKKMKGSNSSSAEASGWTGKEFSDPDAPSVYTDGCCFNNGKKGAVGGIGVYWGHGHKDNVSDKLTGKPTNNRAEIHAALKAVRQAKGKGIGNLVINTDSEFLINSITKWIKGWKKKDWKTAAGGSVINKEDFQELDEALQGINVKWVHVRGHQGIPGNEAADRLANEGARMK